MPEPQDVGRATKTVSHVFFYPYLNPDFLQGETEETTTTETTLSASTL